jgi:hypothetical protein
MLAPRKAARLPGSKPGRVSFCGELAGLALVRVSLPRWTRIDDDQQELGGVAASVPLAYRFLQRKF